MVFFFGNILTKFCTHQGKVQRWLCCPSSCSGPPPGWWWAGGRFPLCRNGIRRPAGSWYSASAACTPHSTTHRCPATQLCPSTSYFSSPGKTKTVRVTCTSTKMLKKPILCILFRLLRLTAILLQIFNGYTDFKKTCFTIRNKRLPHGYKDFQYKLLH